MVSWSTSRLPLLTYFLSRNQVGQVQFPPHLKPTSSSKPEKFFVLQLLTSEFVNKLMSCPSPWNVNGMAVFLIHREKKTLFFAIHLNCNILDSFVPLQPPGSVRRMSSSVRTATAFAACGTVTETTTVETTVMSNAVGQTHTYSHSYTVQKRAPCLIL